MTLSPEITEQISQVIRDVVGNNEDAFQDTWLKILQEDIADLDEIREVATKIRKAASNEKVTSIYRDRLLEKPLTENSNFSLEDILESKPDQFPTVSKRPRGGIQGRRCIEVDQDVVDAMRARFGNMPLAQVVRVMLGLKPKTAQNAWQEEEDQLIREFYPDHGSRPLSKILDRAWYCIGVRASELGIKRKWLYKRDRRAYNVVRRERARIERVEANV